MRYFAVECLTPGVQFLQGFWICTVLFACMTCIFTGVLDLHGIVCLHDGHLAGRGVACWSLAVGWAWRALARKGNCVQRIAGGRRRQLF